MRIDVFCRVVDNYGDAGVTWRLARQLVSEHAVAVTLHIDAPLALARLVPALDPRAGDGMHDGVRIRRLDDHAAPATLPDVAIEGFGCGLPPRWLDAMASAERAPVWINLEYLSAEPWIETVHGLPSPQPRLPLTRYFFFPGFTAATGGLLRERGLLERRDAAQRADDEADRDGAKGFLPPFLHPLAAVPGPGLAPWAATGARPVVISLFCYENRALPGLLDAWAEGDEPVLCLVPEGVASATFDAWLAGAVPHAGQACTRGRLTLVTLPFFEQDGYDRLLWACDVNFVRGEDSFVRAQWAARPFAWHIYPQAGDAHRIKLDAFLGRYLALAPAAAAASVRTFWHAWNASDPIATAAAWPAFRRAMPALARHGAQWSERLARLPDLAANLRQFCENRL